MGFDSPDGPTRPASQLTHEVQRHPVVQAMIDRGEHVWLRGELVIPKLELDVRQDLNSGDGVRVTVETFDGTKIGTVHLEITAVGFAPLELKDVGIVGETRTHKSKPSETQPLPPEATDA